MFGLLGRLGAVRGYLRPREVGNGAGIFAKRQSGNIRGIVVRGVQVGTSFEKPGPKRAFLPAKYRSCLPLARSSRYKQKPPARAVHAGRGFLFGKTGS